MNGIVALSIVGLICGFWIIVFGRALYKSVAGRKDQQDQHSGRIVNGKILNVDMSGSGKMSRVNMTVSFPNFSNSEVTESFIFKDSKPHENRYEKGKSVQLILDEDQKKGPSVRLAGGKTKGSNAISFILFLLFGGSLVGTYLLYKLILNEIGGDWNNTDRLEVFEGFTIVGTVFILTMIIMQFTGRLIHLFTGNKKQNEDQKLKLYGISAHAQITKVSETGVKINDNPMIKFEYEFEDQFGTKHKGSDKMVVGMLALANINDQNEKKIVYEKENPSNSRILEAMKMNMISGCTKLVFLFVSMIFTIVLMSMFVSGLIDS